MMSAVCSASPVQRVAVVYLARGAGADVETLFRRFVDSYCAFRSGADADLFVIFKGFDDEKSLATARASFSGINYQPIFTDDDNYDIGAYRVAAEQVPHSEICFLNTYSEVVKDNWLGKMLANVRTPGVGLVGATGSFESLETLDYRFPEFPNVHIRTNAFLLRREHALNFLPRTILSKKEAFFVESGPASLTRRILNAGLSALIVGGNGRGYPPQWWPLSNTFRQGKQANLLIHDNATRSFEQLPWGEKKAASIRTWGGSLLKAQSLLTCES